jgi:hypothetical protein
MFAAWGAFCNPGIRDNRAASSFAMASEFTLFPPAGVLNPTRTEARITSRCVRPRDPYEEYEELVLDCE